MIVINAREGRLGGPPPGDRTSWAVLLVTCNISVWVAMMDDRAQLWMEIRRW